MFLKSSQIFPFGHCFKVQPFQKPNDNNWNFSHCMQIFSIQNVCDSYKSYFWAIVYGPQTMGPQYGRYSVSIRFLFVPLIYYVGIVRLKEEISTQELSNISTFICLAISNVLNGKLECTKAKTNAKQSQSGSIYLVFCCKCLM